MMPKIYTASVVSPHTLCIIGLRNPQTYFPESGQDDDDAMKKTRPVVQGGQEASSVEYMCSVMSYNHLPRFIDVNGIGN